jgi:hypothetical protein
MKDMTGSEARRYYREFTDKMATIYGIEPKEKFIWHPRRKPQDTCHCEPPKAVKQSRKFPCSSGSRRCARDDNYAVS